MDTHRHASFLKIRLIATTLQRMQQRMLSRGSYIQLPKRDIDLDNNERENDLAARLLQFKNCTKVMDGNTEDLRFFNANMADNHLIEHKTKNLLNAVCKRQEIIS
uniref:Uncharacterized protein n=1 Tax=Glossina pallidipes TaxID=7398 RepID=A0A1A9ZWF1_GLOPL